MMPTEYVGLGPAANRLDEDFVEVGEDVMKGPAILIETVGNAVYFRLKQAHTKRTNRCTDLIVVNLSPFEGSGKIPI